MVNYACGFNQSETGKYFEWIIIIIIHIFENSVIGNKWKDKLNFLNPVNTIRKRLIDIVVTPILRNCINFFLSQGLIGTFFVSSDQISLFLYLQKLFRFFSRKHNPQTALLVRYAVCFFLGGLVGLIPYLVFVIQLCKGLSVFFNSLSDLSWSASKPVCLSVDWSVWLTDWLT